MDTFKTKVRVKNNHKVQIDDVPFEDGQEVEIIISAKNGNRNNEKLKESLKGSVLKYDDPFEPVMSSDDWELLK